MSSLCRLLVVCLVISAGGRAFAQNRDPNKPADRPANKPAEKAGERPAAKPMTQEEKDAAAAVGGTFAVGGLLCVIVSIVAGLVVYFAPIIVALLRGHPNMAPIMIVNFFLGWSLIGWVVALSWAFTAQERHRADYGRSRRRRDDYDD